MERGSRGSDLTCEGVNDEAEDHGDHRDEDPVREPLVLQAAVDGDGRLVTLEPAQRCEIQSHFKYKETVTVPTVRQSPDTLSQTLQPGNSRWSDCTSL